ncbi:hypothetical protein [Maricaulis sp.]|uniref:hypothetical protein n=1 Tax=Maricaulis sp. TaxID=1486257 RepID=UPI002607FD8E|nr:hypothetical protein [Maricaulis sp.]
MALLTALTALALQTTAACGVDDAEHARLMALDEDAFDQDMQGGWRAVANQGPDCFIPAAELIQDYVALHGAANLQRPGLAHWHAGQMFAMAGETERALPELRLSYRPENDNEMNAMWNRYADGTIAFLERDRDALIAARNALPDAPMSNRGVLDGLINCWDRPMMEAYQQDCRSGE